MAMIIITQEFWRDDVLCGASESAIAKPTERKCNDGHLVMYIVFTLGIKHSHRFKTRLLD